MLATKDAFKTPRQFRMSATLFELGPGSKLPDIEKVRKDAAQIKIVEERDSDPELRLMYTNRQGQFLGQMPLSLHYLFQMTDLFSFAGYCHEHDVPSDLVPACIWALEHVIRGAEEGTEDQLEEAGLMRVLGNTKDKKDVLYANMMNARTKVSRHYLNSIINLPEKAAVHLRAAVEAETKRSGDMRNIPSLLLELAIALARTRKNDVEAKEVLTSLYNDLKSGKLEGAGLLINSKVYLARVLRRLEPENPLIKTLQNELIKWFKKNPFRLGERSLHELFLTDLDAKSDPVFLALGGESWLQKRKDTVKTNERLTRKCAYCPASEPQIKVSQCSRCKYTYYCSKECQVAHHPFHKEACKEDAAALKKAQELSISAPAEGRRASDWIIWRRQSRRDVSIALGLALGLDRDSSRSRTHIVFEGVIYVPDAKDPRDRFQVSQTGVYKMDDVWSEIDTIMGLDPGEGKTMINEMLLEFDTINKGTTELMPIFYLRFGLVQPGTTLLGHRVVSKSNLEEYVVCNSSDRNWRKVMNRKGPEPEQLQLCRREIRDAEFIFE